MLTGTPANPCLQPRHLVEQPLQRGEYLHGADHPDVAWALSNLAKVRQSLAANKDAQAQYRLNPADYMKRHGIDVDFESPSLSIDPGDTAALEALLPDRWLAAHPEHRLEQREEESREAQAGRRRKRAARRIAVAQ